MNLEYSLTSAESVPTQTHSSLQVKCISLITRQDRRFALRHGVKEILGQPIEFFDAVEGSRIAKSRLTRFPEGTTSTSYAVRLTKRLVLREFLRTDYRHLLFLEDDVAFSEDFESVLDEALGLETDLFYLGGNHQEPPLDAGRWKEVRHIIANHAVLFTRRGARKVLSLLRKWEVPYSDNEIGLKIRDGNLKAFCPEEAVAFQRETKSDNSGYPGTVCFAQGAIPYMLGDDLAVLDAALNTARLVLEFGSGGSTVHIGKRLEGWGRLVSIEHSEEWFDKVSSVLKGEKLSNVDYLLRPPRGQALTDPFQRGSERALEGYVNAANGVLEANSVDLALIDGRERINCALASAPLLKKGALLMIHDFWPRLRYRVRLPELLEEYEYLFESPCLPEHQGLAVFRKK